MNIALRREVPRDEHDAFWMQEDPYLARDQLSDADIFFFSIRYLCEKRQLFAQFTSLHDACMGTFRASGVDVAVRTRFIRGYFDDAPFENAAAVFFWGFQTYAEGRRVDRNLLRYPGLPTPSDGAPVRHWTHTITPAIARAPSGCHNALTTCSYAFFYAFAGFEELPPTPPWIAEALQHGDDGEAEGMPIRLEPPYRR